MRYLPYIILESGPHSGWHGGRRRKRRPSSPPMCRVMSVRDWPMSYQVVGPRWTVTGVLEGEGLLSLQFSFRSDLSTGWQVQKDAVKSRKKSRETIFRAGFVVWEQRNVLPSKIRLRLASRHSEKPRTREIVVVKLLRRISFLTTKWGKDKGTDFRRHSVKISFNCPGWKQATAGGDLRRNGGALHLLPILRRWTWHWKRRGRSPRERGGSWFDSSFLLWQFEARRKYFSLQDFDMHSEGNAGKEKRGAGRGISARKKSLEQKTNVFFILWENSSYFLDISEKCFYSWVFFHENDLGMTKTVESAEECQGYCQQVANDFPNFSYFFCGK